MSKLGEPALCNQSKAFTGRYLLRETQALYSTFTYFSSADVSFAFFFFFRSTCARTSDGTVMSNYERRRENAMRIVNQNIAIDMTAQAA